MYVHDFVCARVSMVCVCVYFICSIWKWYGESHLLFFVQISQRSQKNQPIDRFDRIGQTSQLDGILLLFIESHNSQMKIID